MSIVLMSATKEYEEDSEKIGTESAVADINSIKQCDFYLKIQQAHLFSGGLESKINVNGSRIRGMTTVLFTKRHADEFTNRDILTNLGNRELHECIDGKLGIPDIW